MHVFVLFSLHVQVQYMMSLHVNQQKCVHLHSKIQNLRRHYIFKQLYILARRNNTRKKLQHDFLDWWWCVLVHVLITIGTYNDLIWEHDWYSGQSWSAGGTDKLGKFNSRTPSTTAAVAQWRRLVARACHIQSNTMHYRRKLSINPRTDKRVSDGSVAVTPCTPSMEKLMWLACQVPCSPLSPASRCRSHAGTTSHVLVAMAVDHQNNDFRLDKKPIIESIKIVFVGWIPWHMHPCS